MRNRAMTLPNVVYLGFAERAGYVREGNTPLHKWNVIGLKHILLSPIFPVSLQGLYFGLAIRSGALVGDVVLSFRNPAGQEVAWLQLTTTSLPADHVEQPSAEGPPLLIAREGWTPVFVRIVQPDFFIPEPGIYLVAIRGDPPEPIIGQVEFAVVTPLPLTPERVAAIRSDPHAAKVVRLVYGCKKCPDSLTAYAALERNTKHEQEGAIWYQDLPDSFRCTCGASTMDLTTVRSNLFAFLGHDMRQGEEILAYTPLYERSGLESLLTDYRELLGSTPSEEHLQKFMEANPVLLHQFPAEKLFFKPPILTFFNADFAVVTPQKELLLIEIEKTTTRLMKKDGDEAAALGHAFNQVRNWLHVVDDHRLAVLDSLKISRDAVSAIRGCVIAGRDVGYDAEHLRRLKGQDRGRVVFLTFDDLAFSLASLIRRMTAL